MADPDTFAENDTPYALKIDQDITQQAIKRFPILVKAVGTEKFDAVLRELYLDSFIFADEYGNTRVALTDLQTVAVVYALGAFLKAGAEFNGVRAWAGRYVEAEHGDLTDDVPF